MRILFIGSGALACPALERLAASSADPLVGVVCQPDRPQGRQRRTGSCPVKALAEKQGLPHWMPEKIGAKESVERIEKLAPDLIVVADYGQYLPARILDLPVHGAINIHPSLLPKYRGATPIQWAIALGETVTGVTLLYVSGEMDAGDIIRQVEAPIRDEDTCASLEPRLAELGAELLLQVIPDIRAGTVRRVPQDHDRATHVHKLTKEDGRIRWCLSAVEICNRVRGFHPWPGSFCESPKDSSRFLKILQARVDQRSGRPGEILACDPDGPVIAAGKGAVQFLQVQPEGKKPMSGRDYLSGYRWSSGDVLS